MRERQIERIDRCEKHIHRRNKNEKKKNHMKKVIKMRTKMKYERAANGKYTDLVADRQKDRTRDNNRGNERDGEGKGGKKNFIDLHKKQKSREQT